MVLAPLVALHRFKFLATPMAVQNAFRYALAK